MPSRTVPRNQPSSHQRRSQRAGQAGVLPGCGQKCTGYLEDVLLSERKETRGDDGLTRPPQVVLGSQSQTSGLGGGSVGASGSGTSGDPVQNGNACVRSWKDLEAETGDGCTTRGECSRPLHRARKHG